jgi:hypothetical protein
MCFELGGGCICECEDSTGSGGSGPNGAGGAGGFGETQGSGL